MKKVYSWFWLVVEVLPVLLPGVLAAFGTVVVALLIAEQLRNVFVWPLGLVAALLVGWIIVRRFPIKRPGSEGERHLFDVLVTLGVIIWIAFNIFFTAQSVFVTRDPGIYAITGKWLITHQQTNIETPHITPYTQGVINHSSGVWKDYNSKDPNRLQPQGLHLLPALLGLAGRLFAQRIIFKLNVLFGGLALLSVYGFARLLVKPRWAAFGTALLAASLPIIYFARDTFTEPIAATLTFGALSLLWLAHSQEHQSKIRNLLPLWWVAGLTAGAGALTRPDGYLTVSAIAIFLVVATVISDKKQHPNMLYKSLTFLFGAAIPMLIGWTDMTHLTSSYYRSHGKDVRIQVALLVLILVGGIVAAILSWRTPVLQYLDKKTKNWRGYIAAILVIVGFLLLMARPLAVKSIFARTTNAVGATNVIQSQEGRVLEPRTYAEGTMDWISWYIGLPMLTLGIVGLSIAAYRTMKDKQLLLMPGLLVVGLTSLMYILNPRITPDHIWAARRFVPVILPGLVVFGVYCFEKIIENYIDLKNRFNQVFVALFWAFVIMQPLLISRPFLLVREKATELNAMQTFCQNLSHHDLVVWLGGSLELAAVQSTRAFCEVQSIGYSFASSQTYKTNKTLDRSILQRIYKDANSHGYRPIIAIQGSQKILFKPQEIRDFKPVAVYQGREIEKTLTDPPRNALYISNSVELATLLPNGSIKPFSLQ